MAVPARSFLAQPAAQLCERDFVDLDFFVGSFAAAFADFSEFARTEKENLLVAEAGRGWPAAEFFPFVGFVAGFFAEFAFCSLKELFAMIMFVSREASGKFERVLLHWDPKLLGQTRRFQE